MFRVSLLQHGEKSDNRISFSHGVLLCSVMLSYVMA